jgi:hypothetical protein
MNQSENTEEVLFSWQEKVFQVTRSDLEGPMTKDLMELFSCNVVVTRDEKHFPVTRISDMFRSRVEELCPEIKTLADGLYQSYHDRGVQGLSLVDIAYFKSLPPLIRLVCWRRLMSLGTTNFEFIKSMNFHFSDSVLRIFLDFQKK